MEIQLTSDQVLAMAPDSSSASAGKKLGNAKHWKSLGVNAEVLWGECQGSALYQVKIDLSSLTSQCSCPSRKLPCKHSLGLLLLAATTGVLTTGPPEWVTSWLAKRQASSVRKQERAEKAVQAADGPPSAAQLKTAEKRLASVKKGLETLDLWLNDLMRQGLASVSTQPDSFWEQQAARLRDAQAPALDTRVRRLAAIPNASPTWPEKLLAELGKLALLTHAFHQEEQLEPDMREEVRQLIGWNLTQDEVSVRGESVQDDWLILGQVVEEETRGKTQRTWLYGLRSGRSAMILQFSIAGQPFPEHFPLGSHQEAELTFWPGAYPQRAFIKNRLGEFAPLKDTLPGVDNIDVFLTNVARMLNHQPWLDRFLCVLHEVTPLYNEDGNAWYIRDSEGRALPFASNDGWLFLALAGGHPVDLAAEWDGMVLRPLGMMAGGAYALLI
ncbi:MAG TPA: SWIM zinc finger family protein [Ktedonobacteraceae bacterium]|nr:SWIM zinc finger family protein [Ktedonobacteraceae bacterium]